MNCSQSFNVGRIANDENFANLDRNLQNFVCKLASQQTILSDIVKDESKEIRVHLDTTISRLEEAHFDDRTHRQDERWYDELTQSLFYPELTSRQEQTEENFDGIEDSYDWIFDEPRSSTKGAPTWADFPQWLKSGDKVYWISGKAGAGKLTLMNRVCNHEQTRRLLEEWSKGQQLLIPTHFFWNTGIHNQKTIEGLLRSLNYQMLTECHQLAKCVEVS